MIGHCTRFRENDDLPLWGGPAVKKKPPLLRSRWSRVKLCTVGMRSAILGNDLNSLFCSSPRTNRFVSKSFFSFSGGMAESVKSESEKRSYKFDDIFEHVSSFGRYQKILYFCTCLIVFPVANQFSLLVFGFGTPGFHCVTPNVTCNPKKCCDRCTSYEFDGPFHSTVSEVGIVSITIFQLLN